MAKNKDKDTEAIIDDFGDLDAPMRVYELGFHIDPDLPIEEVKKEYQTIHKLISEKNDVVAEVEPEKIQLAYTISRQDVSGRRDFSTAYFAWIVYESSASDHDNIINAMGTDKHIVRFIDLITTKDSARHALNVHNLLIKPKEEEAPSEEEKVLDTEINAALANTEV